VWPRIAGSPHHPLARWIPRSELMSKALETWPLDLIEDALGPRRLRILPEAICTAELRVRLPRHAIAMLEYRAGQHRTTIRGILIHDLDDVASTSADEYAAATLRFAAVICSGAMLGGKTFVRWLLVRHRLHDGVHPGPADRALRLRVIRRARPRLHPLPHLLPAARPSSRVRD
jgi:hypothetical protein